MALPFAEVEYNEAQQDFQVIPAGTYKVVCTADSEDTLSSKGADQIKMKLEILEGPCKGRVLINYITDGPKASSFIGQALKGFNIPLSGVTTVTAATFVGKVATAETIVNPQGYANIKKWVNTTTTVAPVQEADDDDFM